MEENLVEVVEATNVGSIKKRLLIVGAVAAGLLVGYALIKRRRNKKNANTVNSKFTQSCSNNEAEKDKKEG